MLSNTATFVGTVEDHEVHLVVALFRGHVTLLVDGTTRATGRLTRTEPTISVQLETHAGSRTVTASIDRARLSHRLQWGETSVPLELRQAPRWFVAPSMVRVGYVALLFFLDPNPLLRSLDYFGAAAGTPRALIAAAVYLPLLLLGALLPFLLWRARDGNTRESFKASA